jgi:hypothetical protein
LFIAGFVGAATRDVTRPIPGTPRLALPFDLGELYKLLFVWFSCIGSTSSDQQRRGQHPAHASRLGLYGEDRALRPCSASSPTHRGHGTRSRARRERGNEVGGASARSRVMVALAMFIIPVRFLAALAASPALDRHG